MKKRSLCLILFVLLAAQICVILYFGTRKKGFHEDEYYSWYSTNRTSGLIVPEDGYLTSEDIMRELTVQSGEGFRYRQVHEYQSWDVHPPLFYDLLHTVCSLTPGVFSKWQGIAVNLAGFVLGFFLVYLLSLEVSVPFTDPVGTGQVTGTACPGKRAVSGIICAAVWGFNPMTISCVLFIRMYMWLTVWVLSCALLHIRFMRIIGKGDSKDKSQILRILVLMGITDILGFLTHYYYIVFLFACGLLTVAAALIRRGIPGKTGLLAGYCVCHVLSPGVCVLIYPSCVSHILRGYRGKEAVSSMFDLSDLIQRFSFFTGLADGYLFGSLLWIVIILAAVSVVSFVMRKDDTGKGFLFLLFVSLFYFFVVSKTALLLGDTSNRYMMPVYPVFILLSVLAALYTVRDKRALMTAVTVFFLFIDIKGTVIDPKVLFLYKEDEERIEYARAAVSEGIPAAVCYNAQTPDHLWFLIDELLEYPEIYCTSGDYTAEGRTLVYVHDSREDGNGFPDKILQDVTPVSEKAMWKLYRTGP